MPTAKHFARRQAVQPFLDADVTGQLFFRWHRSFSCRKANIVKTNADPLDLRRVDWLDVGKRFCTTYKSKRRSECNAPLRHKLRTTKVQLENVLDAYNQ